MRARGVNEAASRSTDLRKLHGSRKAGPSYLRFGSHAFICTGETQFQVHAKARHVLRQLWVCMGV